MNKKSPAISVTRFGNDELKSNHSFRNTLIMLIAVIVSCVSIVYIMMFFEQSLLRQLYMTKLQPDNNTWVSSLASYWGGILGGLISGMIALGGTFLVIRYYRNADLTNRRLSNQPFLKIDCIQSLLNASVDTDDQNIVIGSNPYLAINCSIKNIGKSFAQTITVNSGTTIGGKKYIKTFEVGMAIKDFGISVPHCEGNYEIFLTFFDSYMNEYAQSFEIDIYKNNDADGFLVEITSNYPQLISTKMR